MMAKLGKFSTGLGVAQPKSASFKNSNGGYGKKMSAMADFNKMEPRNRPKPTYVGAAPDPMVHRKKG